MKILFLSLLFFLIASYLNHQTVMPKINISKQDSALNIDHKILKLFTLGQNRLISDFMWISTLLESDLSHYKKKDLNSWMFLRFYSIAEIDPLFLINYQFGGQYLSIIKDDLKGAEILFDLGLSHYPKDFSLNFNAGFLQAFELQNYKKALKHYQTIVHNHKSPGYIISVINKLMLSTTGDLELVFKLVKKSYMDAKDPYLKKRLYKDLYAIKATIDLECLNKYSNSCNIRDYDDNLYIKRGNKYIAPKNFEKYKFFNKNN